jgi:predicted metal-dependent phosphoesterase TrpH
VLVVTSDDKRVRTLPTLGLYVQDPAMYCYRPYLGDLHAHSTGSDGRQEPAYCAMRARWHGFDFFALTDHNNFASSAEMMRKARPRLGRRMLLLRGEELHTAPAPYHYVGIGHRQSVEALRKTQRRQYHRELRRILDELKGRRTAPHLDLVAYAEGLWKIRKARELGGLALYAHPYWSYQNTLCLDEAEREQAFLDREFDAVEVTTTADHTFLMSNRLARETLDRGPVSIVGISDSHNWGPAGTSGRHWTYIMAEGLTRRSLFDAIRNRRSLACEDVGGRLRLEGPFELVDFADFYHRKLLPLRRRITRLEAELALSSLRQGPYDREVVEKLDEELDALDRGMWA